MKESIFIRVFIPILLLCSIVSSVLAIVFYKKYIAEKRLTCAYVELVNDIYESNNDLFLDVIMEAPTWEKLQQAYDKNLEIPDTIQWDWETMREL